MLAALDWSKYAATSYVDKCDPKALSVKVAHLPCLTACSHTKRKISSTENCFRSSLILNHHCKRCIDSLPHYHHDQ